MDNFLDEVIGFQKDRSQEVRKFLIGFIEEVCKNDPDVLPKVITNLQIFMSDDVLAIRKRVIQVTITDIRAVSSQKSSWYKETGTSH